MEDISLPNRSPLLATSHFNLPALCFIFESLQICIHSALRSVAETEVARRPGKFDADRCRPGKESEQLEIWNFTREIQQNYVLTSYKGSKNGQYKVNLVFGKP